jgi:hypothetical protein
VSDSNGRAARTECYANSNAGRKGTWIAVLGAEAGIKPLISCYERCIIVSDSDCRAVRAECYAISNAGRKGSWIAVLGTEPGSRPWISCYVRKSIVSDSDCTRRGQGGSTRGAEEGFSEKH